MLTALAVLLVLLVAGVIAMIALAARRLSRQNMTDTAARAHALPDPRRYLDSLSVRAALITVLALVLLIPLGLVGGVVDERGARYASVLDDIAATWGAPQTLLGPVLVVPYTDLVVIQQSSVDASGAHRTIDKTMRYRRTARFLPDRLSIDVDLENTFRQRGIYRSLVYGANIELVASFPTIDVDALSEHIENIHWDKAWLAVGLSDTRAINSVSSLEWNGTPSTLSPGTGLDELGAGFRASLPQLAVDGAHELNLSLSANGSGAFTFAPLGEITTVQMRSSWPHPSFRGDALPDEHTIDGSGFSARWEIPHLARNYPQSWSDGDADAITNVPDLHEFIAGASLFEPVSLYSQITRSVKYGVLFIGLTFLTLLAFEASIGRRMHLVQYALIGVSLCLFYLVVLSLSEHTSFVTAYVSGSAVTIAMISGYVRALLHSSPRALLVAALLCALYAILYSLLQLEDFALLMGTILLVTILLALMVATRRLHGTIAPEVPQLSDTVA